MLLNLLFNFAIKLKYALIFCILLPLNCLANDAILTWVSEPEAGRTQINVQQLINDEWQAVNVVYTSRELNLTPSIASNSIGETMVVWSSKSTVRSTIRARLFKNGRWEKNAIIANQGGQTTTPIIAFDRNNNAHVVWTSDHAGLDDIYQRQWITSSKEWREIKKVNNDNEVPDILPTVELDANDDILIQWQSASLETNNYIEQSNTIAVNNSAQSNIITSQDSSEPQLSYSDIKMPKDWQGYIGTAIIYFPNNHSNKYERLPSQQ